MKKGYLQTLEAVIVVIVIVTVIISFKFVSEEQGGVPENVENAHIFILNSILSNDDYRNVIGSLDVSATEGFKIDKDSISSTINLPPGYGATFDLMKLEIGGDASVGIEGSVPIGFDYVLQVCNVGINLNLCAPPSTLPDKSVYLDSAYLIFKDYSRILRFYICESSCR